MNALQSLVVVVGTGLCIACSSSSAADASLDASSGDGGLSATDVGAMKSGADSLSVNQQTAALANDLFDFDPTINASGTAAANATAIGANIQAELGSSCGKATVSGTSVTVSFGAAPGCTLKNGDVVSGTVDLSVAKASATITVALTLDDVVVNGVSMSGTASFATTNGTTFAVTTNLTSGSKTDVAMLTVTGSDGSFVLAGTATDTDGSTKTELTFAGLTVTPGQCYASAGSLTVTQASVTEVLTFSATTPATGQVSVTIGKHTSTSTLPAYGSCPSDSSGASHDAG